MKSCFIFQVIIGLTVFDCHIFKKHRHARKEIKLSLPDSELPVTSRVTLPKMCPDMEFSGPCFLEFGLNAEIYELNLCIQSKYGKIQARKLPYLETFSAVHQMNKDIRILGN